MSQVADNFDLYANVNLDTANANWARLTGANTASLRVGADKKVYGTVGAITCLHRRNDVVPLTADYSVQMLVTYVGNPRTNFRLGPAVRVDNVGNTNTCYAFVLYRQGNGNPWPVLFKFVNGVATSLGANLFATHQVPAGESRTLKIAVNGSQIDCYLNGVIVISVNDTSITAAGRPGINAYEATATDIATSGLRGDDWVFEDSPPQFSSATVSGKKVVVATSENVTFGSGGSGGLVLTGSRSGAQSAAYVSGSGTSNIVFSVPNEFKFKEAVTFSFAQPGDGWETVANGTDLGLFAGRSATNSTPCVRFRSVRNNLQVSFNSSQSHDPNGSIASYAWNFGDSNTSSSANPSHTYASAGTYTVTLVITDSFGGTATETQIITVKADQSADVYVAPGATAPASWADTSQPSAVGSGDDVAAKAMGAWDVPAEYMHWTWSDTVTVWVGAGHAREIDRVEVYCNNGSAAVCVKPEKVPGGRGRLGFPFKLRASDFTSNQFLEFRAHIYPKVGQVRVLQDSMGLETHWQSWYSTANATIVTKYLNTAAAGGGDGSVGTPYNDLSSVINLKNSSPSALWLLRLVSSTVPLMGTPSIAGSRWPGALRIIPHAGSATVQFDGRSNVDANGLMRMPGAVLTFGPGVTYDMLPSTTVRDFLNPSSKSPNLYDGLLIFDRSVITSTLGMGDWGHVQTPISIGATSLILHPGDNLPSTGSNYNLGNQDSVISSNISWSGKTDNGDGTFTLTGVTGVTSNFTQEAMIGSVQTNRRNTFGATLITIIADRATIHDVGMGVPVSLKYQRQCDMYNIGAEAMLYNGCALDCLYYDVIPQGHSDVLQPYYDISTSGPIVDNYYVDGVVAKMYLRGFASQAGNITDDQSGYANTLLRRFVFEGDLATQLTLACDGGQFFRGLFMDQCTLLGTNLRLASFGAGTSWENARIRRSYANTISVESIKSTSYNLRIEDSYSRTAPPANTNEWAFSIGTGAAETALFKSPLNTNYGVRDLHLIDGGPLDVGLSDDLEWPTYDVEGHANTGQIGATNTDVNESPTDIQLSSTSVPENNDIGDVIALVTVVDPNVGDTHTISIKPVGDYAAFSISNYNLLAAVVFDSDTKDEYSLTLIADDGQSDPFEKQFVIEIVDVDDQPPVLSSATVSAIGDSLSVVFDEPVVLASGTGGISLSSSSGVAITVSYLSGSGSGTLVFSTSRNVQRHESILATVTSSGITDIAGNTLGNTTRLVQNLSLVGFSFPSKADVRSEVAVGNGEFGTLVVPNASVVVSGTAFDNTVGVYPSTEASKAEQLAIDVSAVDSAKASLLSSETLLGVNGTYVSPAASDVLSSAEYGPDGSIQGTASGYSDLVRMVARISPKVG